MNTPTPEARPVCACGCGYPLVDSLYWYSEICHMRWLGQQSRRTPAVRMFCGSTYTEKDAAEAEAEYVRQRQQPFEEAAEAAAAIADALLHPQDRAYSVPQLFDFIERAGLRFARWVRQAAYDPGCGAMAQLPQQARVARLPLREQYAAAEKRWDQK